MPTPTQLMLMILSARYIFWPKTNARHLLLGSDFFKIIKKILDGNFVKDQRDYRGRSAVEFFSPYNVRQQNPHLELQLLLENFFKRFMLSDIILI
jgi:hypothetical protein